MAIARPSESECGRKRKSAPQVVNDVELPSAHSLVHNPSGILQKPLAISERQFIAAAETEAMPHVERGEPIVPHAIVPIQDYRRIADRLLAADGRRIIHTLGECVIGSKRRSAPEPAIQIDAGRVVTVDRRCEVLIDAVQLRVWSQRAGGEIFRPIYQAGGTVRSRSRANGWNHRVGIRT